GRASYLQRLNSAATRQVERAPGLGFAASGLARAEAEPVVRLEQRQRLGLGRPRRGAPVVAPLDRRREARQDALGAPAGLEAEVRAAVEGEGELGVAPAAEPLERRLARPPRGVLPPLGDGDVGRQERAPGLAHEV